MTERARTLADGVVQLPTDYPAAHDAPLWLYAVGSGDAIALIDSAIPTSLDAGVGDALAEAGLDVAAIRDVLLTHGHPDHQGGARSWQAGSGARISAPLDDVTWIEDPERQWRELWDGYPGAISLVDGRDGLIGMCGGAIRVDRLLRDGDRVEVGGGSGDPERAIEVIQTRGHTRGHMAFLERQSGCLFTGDVVQGRGLRTISGSTVISPMYEDVVDYRAGLERLLATPFEWLCAAHRDPLGADAGLALIRESLAFIDEVDDLVRSELARADGPVPSRVVAAAVGRLVGARPGVTMQTVTTALAHLTELARTGAIEESWATVGRPGGP